MTATQQVSPLPDSIVYVIDDDASVCSAIRLLLESVGLAARTFASAREFLDAMDRLEPSSGPACLILDVRMPGMSGLDLQQELTDRQLSLPIIFISGHGDIPMSVQAMKKGATDFIPKPFQDQQLLDAIHKALEIHEAQRARMAEVAEIRTRAGRLTPRETEVFLLVVEGLPNRLIGERLGASEKTIKVHRARVMRKMEADSLPELVRMAGKIRS